MGKEKGGSRKAGFPAAFGRRRRLAEEAGQEGEGGCDSRRRNGDGEGVAPPQGTPPHLHGEEVPEKYFASLIDNSFDLIFVTDAQGKVLFMGPSVERTLGYKPHEVVGTSSFGYLHPDDVARVIDFFARGAARSGFSRNVTCRVKHRDGTWRHMEAVGHNLLHDPVVRGIVINARDITEQVRLREELKRSEEYFRSIIEAASDIVAVLDREGTVRYASPSTREVIGYEPQELVGRNLFEFTHPDDIGDSTAALAFAAGRPGITRYANVRIRHKDGSWRYFEAAANNLLDSPAVNGMVILARDVTDRHLWEEALRESEERYRLIFDHSGDAVFTYDAELKLTGVNRRGCELIAYRPEELLGHNIFELGILHPDDYQTGFTNNQRLFAGEIARAELRFLRKDGTVLVGDVTGAPLFNRQGEVVEIINIVRDVTERKRNEERLEALNRCLLNLGPDPLENIMNVVSTGNDVLGTCRLAYCRLDKGRFQCFSPARRGDGFFAPEEPERFLSFGLISSDFASPVILNDAEEARAARDPFLGGGDFHYLAALPVRLGESALGCLCCFAPEENDLTAETIGFLGMLARAITIEEERRAYEESIRHFVDIASHELRTPLSIIKGYADAFVCGDLMELNDMQMEKIRIINKKADKMAKTINDLLDLSRIERGEFVVEKSAVDARSAVESSIAQMLERGAQNRFLLSMAEEPLLIQADPDKLSDVLVILLDNAINYSPTGSEIEVEVLPHDGGAIFSVKDRGPGIPQKEREGIFERFYQLEDSRHHSSTGMGLGLFIAREIVRGHGGKIWYEAREGGGSVFRFTIP
ncbi:MAG: PAS domain S-box protein [Actinobacteria bacterium]|nr:PAS domain S-box protein [Actinomycetota bacterium]